MTTFDDLKKSLEEMRSVLKGEIPPSRVWKIDDNGERILLEDNTAYYQQHQEQSPQEVSP